METNPRFHLGLFTFNPYRGCYPRFHLGLVGEIIYLKQMPSIFILAPSATNLSYQRRRLNCYKPELTSTLTDMSKNNSLFHLILEISVVFPLMIAHRIFYELIGKYNSQGERDYGYLLFSGWDSMIPDVPVFIIPYLSAWLYPFVIIAVYIYSRLPSVVNFFRTIYFSFFILMLVCYSIYLLFPVFVPVQLSPSATPGFLDSLVLWTYNSTTTWNAFPSAHVAIPYFVWLVMKTVVKDISRWIYFIYFLLISLSVVFIKIHYLADILGGIIVAQVIYSYCFLPLWQSQYLLKKPLWILVGFYYSLGLIAVFLCQISGYKC